jgi:oxidase EvaA
MKQNEWIKDWFSSVQELSKFQVTMVCLSSSSTWQLTDGIIRHDSGRFFNVVGLRWISPEGKEIIQPIIEQREIGTLGFLLYSNGNSPELLAYAKIEPGNIGVVQLAPTCQATESNIARVHGGDAPPCCEYFIPSENHFIAESLQSEQGTRFLGKLNRNILSTTDNKLSSGATHRWLPVDEVLEVLKYDYLVNTDARSVLVCSPWDVLVNRAPFTRHNTIFAKDLTESAVQEGRYKDLSDIRSELDSIRITINQPEIIPLEEMDGWDITDTGIIPADGKPFAIRYIDVIAEGREVQRWDQPIVDSTGQGYNELVCARIDGILHFLFRPQIEPGLYNMVELGPSLIVEPGDEIPGEIYANQLGASVMAECLQSDEGGRFYQDSTLYRIVDIGDAGDVPSDCCWLTLKQVQELLKEQGWFTNEARSALSLVLAWL